MGQAMRAILLASATAATLIGSWVAVDENSKVVGFALARPDFHEDGAISLRYIGVSKNARQCGICSTFIEKLRTNNVPLTASVLHNNRSQMAERLVKKGFAKVEVFFELGTLRLVVRKLRSTSCLCQEDNWESLSSRCSLSFSTPIAIHLALAFFRIPFRLNDYSVTRVRDIVAERRCSLSDRLPRGRLFVPRRYQLRVVTVSRNSSKKKLPCW